MVFAGDVVRQGDAYTDWTTFTPTWNNVTMGTGAINSGRWRRVGNFMIEFRAQLSLGTSPSITGFVGLVLPGGLSGDATSLRQFMPAWGFDSSASAGFPGIASLQTGGGANLDRFYGPATTSTGWNSTTPITWAVGDIFMVQGWLEVTT